jgi:aryl-alcohol dehydrogenase-like predicted oxidoreductase
MNRREAIGALGALGVSAMSTSLDAAPLHAATPAQTGAAGAANASARKELPGMLYRPLGKTGEKVSALGLGGFHIGVPKDPAEGVRIIRTAIDRGVTFMDNCWDYHDGESERRMGTALLDGYRQRVFLMTKFDGRTKASTAAQIDESLKRLQTDVIDLMQYHENIRLEDPDRFFAANGPLEALLEAKKAGKIRFIGFTGHKDPLVHLRMLDVAAAHDFHFDACQMPLNVLDAHFRSFGQQVVPRLVKEGLAVLGMKPLASGAALKTNVVTATECLHYALNLQTSVVINGCDTMERLEQGLEAVKTFKPMTEPQVQALLAKTKAPASNGQFELFKTGIQFDGTARNPQWMG